MVNAFVSSRMSFAIYPFSRTAIKFSVFVSFIVIWTLYGAISGLPSAIHHDTAEAYIWGREFQLGYYKHPPFWAWTAGAWFMFAPHKDWAFCLLATINAAIGLWGSWRLIGNFTAGRPRAAATLLLLLTPCFTFLAYKFNANSIFLSLWPWALHYFVRSFENRRLIDAALFGVFMAAAMLSKYFAAVLAASCLIASLTQPSWRRYYTSSSPYLSFAVALILLSPHIWWLFQTGFMPVHYFLAETGLSYVPVINHALGSITAIVLFHLLVVAVVGSCATRPLPQWWSATLELWRAPNTRMLVVLALAPTLLTGAVALIFCDKISNNMLIGTVSLIPLLLIKIADVDEARLFRRAMIAAVWVSLTALALAPAIAIVEMRFSREPNIMQPRAEAAQLATGIWHSTTNAPLTYVAGSEFYANATSFYSADHPHVFIDFDYRKAPWVTPERLLHRGLLVICDDADKTCLDNARRNLTQRTSLTHFTLARVYAGLSKPAVQFTVFVSPPEASVTDSKSPG
jgi:4-amino-4-deoxy-L-arabinose transferase-like glycosyltransferase